MDKINRNVANDVKATEALLKNGWNIYTIWECELKKDKIEKTLLQLVSKFRKP